MTGQMMQVPTRDVGLILDYLEGFISIMRRFQTSGGIGRTLATELARGLQDLDLDDPLCFHPLRYETDVPGAGWEAVAVAVGQLRERLLEGYADAAL